MTNFEKLKQMDAAEFARFIIDGTESSDFFIFNSNGSEGEWHGFHDFIRWLKSEAVEKLDKEPPERRLIDAVELEANMNKLYTHHLEMGNFSADAAVCDCIQMVKDAPTIARV